MLEANGFVPHAFTRFSKLAYTRSFKGHARRSRPRFLRPVEPYNYHPENIRRTSDQSSSSENLVYAVQVRTEFPFHSKKRKCSKPHRSNALRLYWYLAASSTYQSAGIFSRSASLHLALLPSPNYGPRTFFGFRPLSRTPLAKDACQGALRLRRMQKPSFKIPKLRQGVLALKDALTWTKICQFFLRRRHSTSMSIRNAAVESGPQVQVRWDGIVFCPARESFDNESLTRAIHDPTIYAYMRTPYPGSPPKIGRR